MSVTATTAPARAPINTFSTTQITVSSAGLVVTVQMKDSGGNPINELGIDVDANRARRLIYSAGAPIVDPGTPLTISGIMATILTAFFSASGNVTARLAAVDPVLQSNGIVPA